MEDEISKHTKKIIGTVKNRNHSFLEKLKEIAIEIFIIIFAVTLSMWFHNWSEHRHEQKEAGEFLRGLKEDLSKDIKLLTENRDVIARLDSNFKYLLAIKNSRPKDSALIQDIYHHLYFDLRITHPNIGRYEGFKSSGKIGTIENDSLKEFILVLYQQTIPDLKGGEEFINSLQLKILDLQLDNAKQPVGDFISTMKMKALLGLGVHNFEVTIDAYNETITQAKKIIAEIEKDSS